MIHTEQAFEAEIEAHLLARGYELTSPTSPSRVIDMLHEGPTSIIVVAINEECRDLTGTRPHVSLSKGKKSPACSILDAGRIRCPPRRKNTPKLVPIRHFIKKLTAES